MSTIASPFELSPHAHRLPLPPPDGRYVVGRGAPAVALIDSATDTAIAEPAAAASRLTVTARAAVLVAICTAGALTAASLAMQAIDEQAGDAGAAAVPVVALIGMAVVVVRRCPDHRADSVRPVGITLALGLAVTAIAILVATLALPDARGDLLGPALSVATIGSFLGLWGLRSPALLRSVSILGLMTWTWIAEAVHSVVRTSLDLPSDMVYRRLATMPVLGVVDEPWRLHTALLHRGTLVVVATIVIGFAASRWRLSTRNVVDVGVVTFVALVAHHVVLLASPVDDYAPGDAARFASHPVLEVGVGVAAVLALACVRWRRHGAVAPQPASATLAAESSGRDPFIFSTGDSKSHVGIAAMLLATAIPLWTLVVSLAI